MLMVSEHLSAVCKRFSWHVDHDYMTWHFGYLHYSRKLYKIHVTLHILKFLNLKNVKKKWPCKSNIMKKSHTAIKYTMTTFQNCSLFSFWFMFLHRSATAFKPQRFEANIDYLATLQYSAGKHWILAIVDVMLTCTRALPDISGLPVQTTQNCPGWAWGT